MGNGVGLFGKTQFRRDFLSVGLPRPVLTVLETWLAQGLARSRARLGPDWTALFLTMPVWHAVLGRAVCGSAAVGAIMPSMDGAGRCFPLAVLAWSDEPDAAAEAGSGWSDAAEAFLLGTLDEGSSHEAVLGALGSMPDFPQAARPDLAAVSDGQSLWWTRGGERHGPARFTVSGMPGDDALTAMIGGEAASAAAEGDQRHAG